MVNPFNEIERIAHNALWDLIWLEANYAYNEDPKLDRIAFDEALHEKVKAHSKTSQEGLVWFIQNYTIYREEIGNE